MNTITELFRFQTEKNPKAPAVFDDKRRLTRNELDMLSNSIASKIPKGTRRVGIVMNHSVEMIAAILAVLKAGAAYIPAEPFFPDERIRYMLEESEAEFVITNSEYKDKFSPYDTMIVDRGCSFDIAIVNTEVKENDLAYILYTSGSTGKPKGVAVEHRNVCHYVNAFNNEFHIGENDIMLQYSVCTFDIFVEEVFASLLNGAALAIPCEEDKADIYTLMHYCDATGVTVISGFPYLLQEMNALDELPSSLRLLISGGDVVRKSYVDKLVDRVTVYNTYGPSETTVCASYYNCSEGYVLDDGTFPIGRAVKGAEIQILNEKGKPTKPFEIGEICILGNGVSRGYIGNREAENKAFTVLNGKRMYRSGDLGYYLDDGNIAFLYRRDKQVMILGKRVEPDEVQSVIMNFNGIRQAAVVANTDQNNLSYLTAYLVGDNIDLTALKKYMKMYVTEYMIPEHFVLLSSLPVNENGKLDKAKLPLVLKG